MTQPSMFLSKIRLKREASINAMLPLLVPESSSERTHAGHRLLWSLFGDTPERERDFLWREIAPGEFLTLSARRPLDPHGLFHIAEPKSFEPELRAGDRLAFVLRANATVSKGPKGSRGKPCDVVMNELHGIPAGSRGAERRSAVERAGVRWLIGQGERKGFRIDAEVSDSGARDGVRVLGHQVLSIPRKADAMRIGVLDFEGRLTVVDPALFLGALVGGFGRAKAFGLGLMLIRRL